MKDVFKPEDFNTIDYKIVEKCTDDKYIYLAFCETALTETGRCVQDETFWKAFSNMMVALEWCSLNSSMKLTWDEFDDEFMCTSWVKTGGCYDRIYIERHEVLE